MRLIKIAILFLVASISLHASGQENIYWRTILATGTPVKYLVPDQELPANWTAVDFDDAGWTNGIAGIGYGDDDDNTIVPDILSVYVRYAFNLSSLDEISKLILDMDFDDGFVAYLNGKEIGRINLGNPNEPTTFDQLTGTDIEANLYRGLLPARITLPLPVSDLLETGDNILAIEVHNWSSGSSDLSSNAFLHAGYSTDTSAFSDPPSWFIPPSDGSSNLPIILLNTNGQMILNNQRIIAEMDIISNEAGELNYSYDEPNDYSGRISIEIRGASSTMFPKKSYTVETQTDSGTNNNVSLLGLPPENDWVLYAPYSDKSLVRNVISYKLYEQMGHWSPRTRYVDVYLNGSYEGIYVLTEKVKQDRNRVDIAALSPADVSPDQISGGYILQIDRTDNLAQQEFWTSPIYPPYSGSNRNTFEYYDPDFFDLTTAQSGYIKEWINSVDAVIASSGFKNPETGYRKYFDINSFVDYLIFHEINKDVDAYRLSAFFYKERDSDGGKLFAGPPWDYNLTYGNMDYGGDILETYNWMYPKGISMYWFRRLMEDPYFKNQVYCRWSNLANTIATTENMNALIDSSVNILGPAIESNFERWPVLGTYVWPNNFIGDTHEEEIAFLKNWISERLLWIDDQWAYQCIETEAEFPEIDLPQGLIIYPNPSLQANVTMTFPEYYSGSCTVDIYNVQGAKVYSQNVNLLHENSIQVQNLDRLRSGVYLVKFTGQNTMPVYGKLIRN